MAAHHGNLSSSERTTSALLGAGLSLLSLSRMPLGLRLVSGILAGGLLARAAAGHCAVKSALSGDTTFAQGLRDQWQSATGEPGTRTHGLPGSPLHRESSRAVDQSVEESFPASDPPASRLPDEPPVNAEAKWAAARAAGKSPE